MSTMQYEQPRGLASAAHQYQYQQTYSNPQPLPRPNVDQIQQSPPLAQSPPSQNMYFPPPLTQAQSAAFNQYQQPASRPLSPYDPEHAVPVPPTPPNYNYGGSHFEQYQQQPQWQPGQAPPLPQRHHSHSYGGSSSDNYQPPPSQQPVHFGPYQGQPYYAQAPPIPPRDQNRPYTPTTPDPYNNQYQFNTPPTGPNIFSPSQSPKPGFTALPPPPGRNPNHLNYQSEFETINDNDPTHYTRDPQKLVAYLVPFPKPKLNGIDPATIPTRFLIYTPPPPPLKAPKEGEKEGKMHKVQRKWQDEVRTAKSSTAKVASWEGVKSRATKAIAWGVNQTTTSNLEFLGRVNGDNGDAATASSSSDSQSSGGAYNTQATQNQKSNHKQKVNEMLLIYPPSMNLNPTEMRTEFVNTMLRTKSKAQRDSIIATGLLPVTFGIDILATLIWPFGGLGEIDSVWLYSSVKGARTASSVTKRLESSPSSSSSSPSATGSQEKEKENETLHLTFLPSANLDILTRYLQAECHRIDSNKFPDYHTAPTETEVLRAIGWTPSQASHGVPVEERDLEAEMWEVKGVKEDVKSNYHKGAKEWRKFCVAFEKDPERAMGIKRKK